MYRYIFYYFNRTFSSFSYNQKDYTNGIENIIFFFQIVHILFIDTIFMYIFNFSFFKILFNHTYGINKLIFFPIFIFYLILLKYYYRKSWGKIKIKYDGKVSINSLNTILILFFLFILPLVTTIYLRYYFNN